MSKEEGKVVEMKMTPDQQRRAEQEHKRRADADLKVYKQRLKAGVELKRLQVEELELNIRYYESKKAWLELQPKMDELEAKEQALIQKERVDYEKAMKLRDTMAKAEKPEEKPEIVIPKVGKARES